MSDTKARTRIARRTTLALIAGCAVFAGANLYGLLSGGGSFLDLLPGLIVGIVGAGVVVLMVWLVVRRRGARVQKRLRGYDAGVVCQPALDVGGSAWVLAIEGEIFRVFRVDKNTWVPVAKCRVADVRLTRTDVTFNGFRRLPGIQVRADEFAQDFGVLRPSLFAAYTRSADVDRALAPLLRALAR